MKKNLPGSLLLATTLVSSGVVAALIEQPRLINKVVIITGASKGIGKSIAETFSEQGAKLVLVSRTEKPLRDVTEQIRHKGGDV